MHLPKQMLSPKCQRVSNGMKHPKINKQAISLGFKNVAKEGMYSVFINRLKQKPLIYDFFVENHLFNLK